MQSRDVTSPPLPPRANGSPLAAQINEMATYLSQLKADYSGMARTSQFPTPYVVHPIPPTIQGEEGLASTIPASANPLASHHDSGRTSPPIVANQSPERDSYKDYPMPPGYGGETNGQTFMRPEQAPRITRAVMPSETLPTSSEDSRLREQEAMKRILAAAAARKVENAGEGASGASEPNTVEIMLRLGLDFSLVGPENSHQREAFCNHLCQDLSNASGLPPTNFIVKNLAPGSVLVETEIQSDGNTRGVDLETVARDLEKQSTDPFSRLRSGAITRFTESITRKAPRTMSPTPPGTQQRQVSPVSPNRNAAPAPPLLPPSPGRPTASSQSPLPEVPGTRTGVGVIFKRNQFGEIEVIGLRPGSSSEQSGAIFVGDKIISVGPVPVTGVSRETVIDLILGTPGTRVTLGMIRQAGSPGNDGGQATQVNVTLIRAETPSAPPSRAGSAAPIAPASDSAPPMMSAPDSLAQTISRGKEPFEFVGPPRTVALERGLARPGEQAGVGLSFQATKGTGYMVITKVVPGGPADLSQQFKVGDIILRVNNVIVQAKRIPEVVSLIKGPPSTIVVLTLNATSLNPNSVAAQGGGGGSLYNSTSSHGGTRALAYESHDSAPPMSAPVIGAQDAKSDEQEDGPLPPGWEETALGNGTIVWVNHTSKAFSKVRPISLKVPSQSPSTPTTLSSSKEEHKIDRIEADGIRVVRVQRRSRLPNGKAGIGLGFERDPAGVHTVCGLQEGGPAAQSGQIFVKDRIISIDGRPTEGKSIEEVSQMIQGVEGTDVALTLETVDAPEPQIVKTLAPASTRSALSAPDALYSTGSGSVGGGSAPPFQAPTAPDINDGVFIVGLVVGFDGLVLGVDGLEDCNGRQQGQAGYENETIGTEDSVVAISGKMLKNETSEILMQMLSGPRNSMVEIMLRKVICIAQTSWRSWSMLKSLTLAIWHDFSG